MFGVNFESLEDNYDGSVLDPDTYDDDEYDDNGIVRTHDKNLAVNLRTAKPCRPTLTACQQKYRKLLIRCFLTIQMEVSSIRLSAEATI